jgi:hypothetical protein
LRPGVGRRNSRPLHRRTPEAGRPVSRDYCPGNGTVALSDQGIKAAGALHDIGKISLPAEILCKPSRPTETEFTLIKNHPQIGYEVLKEIEFPWPVALSVLEPMKDGMAPVIRKIWRGLTFFRRPESWPWLTWLNPWSTTGLIEPLIIWTRHWRRSERTGGSNMIRT